MARKILAFYSPYPGAGKTTAAKYFMVSKVNFLTLSFAAPIREIIAFMMSWPHRISPYLPEIDDKNVIIPELGASYRELMAQFGAAGRRANENMWVNISKRILYSNGLNYAIDDLRFPNEYAMLRDEGAKIVRIVNPDREIIPSETEALLEGYEFDVELVNDKQDLDNYHAQLDKLLANLWP